MKWRSAMVKLSLLLLIVPASHALRSTQITRRSAVSGVLLAPAAVAIGGARAGATAPPVASTMTPIASAADASTSTEFLSGLIAGFAQKTIKEVTLHPLDTVKTRLQLTSTRRGLLDPALYKDVYSGLAPAVVSGAPAASVFFAIKDSVLQQLKPQLGNTGGTVAAVGCANLVYWLVRNPAEVIKVRRQSGGESDSAAAATALWREIGPGGFYRGYASNVAYAFPVDSSKFVLYSAIKDAWRQSKGGAKLSPLEAAVGGALATMAAQGVSTPLDVARTRIMTLPADQPAPGVLATLKAVADEDGLRGLYAGLAPKVARALVSGALQFSVLEGVKDAVDAALGVKR